uniref:Uncharacterized protein n=1 Tax=Ascaris lumbricoides TaxID=6252 RepID=A0A0M3I180_ASCLU
MKERARDFVHQIPLNRSSTPPLVLQLQNRSGDWAKRFQDEVSEELRGRYAVCPDSLLQPSSLIPCRPAGMLDSCLRHETKDRYRH